MRSLRALPLLLVAGWLLLAPRAAEAATKTWDGGGGADTNWSTPANWNNNTLPVNGDDLVFNATSTNNCTIDVDLTTASNRGPRNVSINAGYTGTITQSAGKAINLTGAWSQATGTFTGSNTAISIATTMTLSGGIFNQPTALLSVTSTLTVSGGTFNGSSAAVTGSGNLTCSSGTFNQPTNTLTVLGTLTVNGGTFVGSSGSIVVGDANGDNFLCSAGTFTSTTGEMQVADDFTVSGTGVFNRNGGTVHLINTGSTSALNIGTAVLNNLILDKGTSTLTVTGTVSVLGTLTITTAGAINSGTFSCEGNVTTTDTDVSGTATVLFTGTGNQTLGASGGSGELPIVTINKTGGTLTMQDTIYDRGNWTYTAGTVDAGSSTVQFNQTGNKTVSSGAMSFNNVTLDMSTATLTVTGTMTVGGSFTVTSVATINTGTISVSGNVTPTDTSVAGSALLQIVGTGAQTFGPASGTGQIVKTTINKPSGTLTLRNTISVIGNWTYTAGTVNAGTSTVQFSTNAITVDSGAMSFNNVEIATGGNALTVTGTMTVAGNLLITTVGNINTGTIAVAGNLTTADTAVAGTGVVKLNGTGSQDIGSSVTSGQFDAVTIDKASGTAMMINPIIFNDLLTITAGTLSQGSGQDLRANAGITIGSGGTLFNTSTGDLTLGGNVSNSGTVSFDSNGGAGATDDIVIQSTNTTARTWSGSGTYSFTDVSVSRQTAGNPPGIITAFSSTNGGSNTNWVFGQSTPVMQLKLDDGSGTSATDSSGSGNNGTLNNGATWNSDRAPLNGTPNYFGVTLDGVNDNISVASSSSIQMGLAFTISAWVKATSVNSGTVLAKWSTTSNQRQYKIELVSGKLVFSVSTAGSSATVRSVTSGASVSAGAWTHLAAVYDGGVMRVYVDGAKTSSTFSVTSAFATGTASLFVGQDTQGTFLNGVVDEVRLYNIALSDSDISALGQKDTIPPGKPINLTLQTNANQDQISAQVTTPSDADVTELIWRYVAVDGNVPPTYPSTPTSGLPLGSGLTTGVSPSTSYTKLATSLAQFKTYGVAVWSRDFAGNYSTGAVLNSIYLSPPSPRLVITAPSGKVIAPAASTVTLTITARDASNNVITAYSGPYSLAWQPVGGSSVTLVNSSSSGWSNGVVTANTSIGGSNAGPGTFSAIDNSAAALQTGTYSFTWYPTAFTVSADASAVTAGKDFSLTVTAKDGAGAVVTRYAGDAALTLSYVSPASGTKILSKASFSSGDFLSGAAKGSVAYMDSGKVQITASDTTYVSGVTITGTSTGISFAPASFGMSKIALPEHLTKVYVGQPFDMTVEALAVDGATVTPNYDGTVTLSGTGAQMQSAVYTFVPSTDKGSHVFEDMTATTSGNLVMEAKAGSITGTADPLGVRAASLVVNPVSGTPGDLQTTVFILDTEKGELVSDDDSTQFTLTLETPSSGAAATSAAESVPVTFSSGAATVTVTKTDSGEVQVGAQVRGFDLPVVPGLFRWQSGDARSGAGLNVLQFEEKAPSQRLRTSPSEIFSEGVTSVRSPKRVPRPPAPPAAFEELPQPITSGEKQKEEKAPGPEDTLTR